MHLVVVVVGNNNIITKIAIERAQEQICFTRSDLFSRAKCCLSVFRVPLIVVFVEYNSITTQLPRVDKIHTHIIFYFYICAAGIISI